MKELTDLKTMKTMPGYEEVKYENKEGEYFGQMKSTQSVKYRAPHFEKTFIKI